MCAGRRSARAQLVVSLVDLATGRVGSRSIVPWVLTPVRTPAGAAALDLSVVVKELAAELGVSSIYRVTLGKLLRWDVDTPILLQLRHAAGVTLSPEWQFEHEGAAIAREAMFRPNLVFYAGVESKPIPSADDALQRLVAMASDLQLDFVIDVRVGSNESLKWKAHFDVPGAAISERPLGRFNTLHRALRETSVEAALVGLQRGPISAPARWLETPGPDYLRHRGRDGVTSDGTKLDSLTWAELSAKMTPLAVRGAGAIGVHRHGEWYFSTLESAPDPENDRRSRLRPVTAIPEPAGELIPTSICPKCGAGTAASCSTCGGAGRMLDGVALTITDLENRTKHVNVRRLPMTGGLDDGAEPNDKPVSGRPLGWGEVLLDRYYSIGEQAKPFGVPPHLLVDHFRNRALDLALIDGKVTAPDGDPQVSGFLGAAAHRRPGGRLIVLARPEPEPPTNDLFRSVLGLGLTVAINVRTADQPRTAPAPVLSAWQIQILPGTVTEAAGAGSAQSPAQLTRPEMWFGLSKPSLRTAVAQLQTGLDNSIRRALVVEKLAPLPVPQQVSPVPVDAVAIELSLEGLGEIFPNTDILLLLTATSCTCFIAEPYNRSACAATIPEMLAPLVAPDLIEPDPEELRRVLTIFLDKNSTQAQLEAETQGIQGRFRFGLALGALLKCLFLERFGADPEQAVLAQYADEIYRDSLGEPTEEEGAPLDPALVTEMLVSLADPTRTAWRRMMLLEDMMVAVHILTNLVVDRLETGAETTGIIDQAVHEGILMAQAMTTNGDGKRGAS